MDRLPAARYWRASRLYHACTLARADGTYIRFLAQLARVDVLVIDDWALASLQDAERGDVLEIPEERYGTRSTIVTSQLPGRAGCRLPSPRPGGAPLIQPLGTARAGRARSGIEGG